MAPMHGTHEVPSATESLQGKVNWIILSPESSDHQIPVCNHCFFFHRPLHLPLTFGPGRALYLEGAPSLISLRSESSVVLFLLGCRSYFGQDFGKGSVRRRPSKPPGFQA